MTTQEKIDKLAAMSASPVFVTRDRQTTVFTVATQSNGYAHVEAHHPDLERALDMALDKAKTAASEMLAQYKRNAAETIASLEAALNA